jgi:hypothetical protein
MDTSVKAFVVVLERNYLCVITSGTETVPRPVIKHRALTEIDRLKLYVRQSSGSTIP